MSSMESHTSNMSFLDVPGTSSSLKVTKTNIQDLYTVRSINPSFVPVTSSAQSVDPIFVPRMIPSYVTILETNQDNNFPTVLVILPKVFIQASFQVLTQVLLKTIIQVLLWQQTLIYLLVQELFQD